MHPRHLVLVIGLLPIVFCAGCSSGTDGEEEHLEHAIPEHKPASYAEAMTEIERRLEELEASSADESKTMVSELLDIVNWIPELAADSDLGEQDWTTARTEAKRLHAGFSANAGKPESLRTKEVEDSLAKLQSLVEAAGRPEPAPPEHDDHDHHHH